MLSLFLLGCRKLKPRMYRSKQIKRARSILTRRWSWNRCQHQVFCTLSSTNHLWYHSTSPTSTRPCWISRLKFCPQTTDSFSNSLGASLSIPKILWTCRSPSTTLTTFRSTTSSMCKWIKLISLSQMNQWELFWNQTERWASDVCLRCRKEVPLFKYSKA